MENLMTGTPVHIVPGEFIHDGMLFTDRTCPQLMNSVKDYSMHRQTGVVGYAKTGNTWANELTWLVLNEGDFETAASTPLFVRIPYLEYKPITDDVPNGMEIISKMPDPKLFKSHLPSSYFKQQLAHDDTKLILTVRNPKDTLVSFFHFYKMAHDLGCFTGTWDEFFTLVEAKHLVYGDFFDWYTTWIPYLNHPKVCLLKYEDMIKDLPGSVRKVARFLQKDLPDDVIHKIVQHTSFDSMKANKMTNFDMLDGFINKDVNSFMRKGKVGQWKDYFTAEQNEWIAERYKKLEHSGLTLEFQ